MLNVAMADKAFPDVATRWDELARGVDS